MHSIIADETIFLQLAMGNNKPYRHLLKEHFSNGETLYILSETIVCLLKNNDLVFPKIVFEPFRILSPSSEAVCRAIRLANQRSIPFYRALIVESARQYKLAIGLTNHKLYGYLGVHRRFYAA